MLFFKTAVKFFYNKKYYFKVKAYKGKSYSSYSKIASATTRNKNAAKAYKKYYSILKSNYYLDVVAIDDGSNLYPISYLKLIDMNGDNIKEMIVVKREMNSDYGFYNYNVDIYTYYKGKHMIVQIIMTRDD